MVSASYNLYQLSTFGDLHFRGYFSLWKKPRKEIACAIISTKCFTLLSLSLPMSFRYLWRWIIDIWFTFFLLGSGAAKIVHSLRDTLSGLSRKKVQEILNNDKCHFKRNAKVCNKATLKPILARDVQTRHQIDLMDLGKHGTVQMERKSYKLC